jgi:hypothetical protein
VGKDVVSDGASVGLSDYIPNDGTSAKASLPSNPTPQQVGNIFIKK